MLEDHREHVVNSEHKEHVVNHLLRIGEVRERVESDGADDGEDGEDSTRQEYHPGIPAQQQDVPETLKLDETLPVTEINDCR